MSTPLKDLTTMTKEELIRYNRTVYRTPYTKEIRDEVKRVNLQLQSLRGNRKIV